MELPQRLTKVDQEKNIFLCYTEKWLHLPSLLENRTASVLTTILSRWSKKNTFFYGQLCSLGILQHSPSPCFFSSSVVDYIVYGKLVNVSTCVEDVPNAKARKSWKNCKVFPIRTSSSKWPHLIVRFDLKLDTQNPL